MFCFKVTATEIIFAQFLYARQEFVVIFVLPNKLQADQMSEWREGQRGWRRLGDCATLKHRKATWVCVVSKISHFSYSRKFYFSKIDNWSVQLDVFASLDTM